MDDTQAAPFGLEVFEDETAVAVVGSGFATEQHGRHGKKVGADALLDLALGHERQEAPLVVFPASPALLIGIEQLLRGGEQRLVEVFGAAELAEEVREVVALGETGKLG